MSGKEEITKHFYLSESLMSLSERLAGPFNVEMTIEPISIKISDAIMNFQESGFQVDCLHLSLSLFEFPISVDNLDKQ